MELPGVMQLPGFAVSIDDVETDVLKLMKLLRPSWSSSDIQFDGLPGRPNKLLLVYLKSDLNKQEAVIVRVLGPGTEILLNNQDRAQIQALLHAADLASPLHAVFKNGFVYGYIKGSCLGFHSFREPNIERLIAQLLANYHKVNPQKLLPSMSFEKHEAEKELHVQQVILTHFDWIPDDLTNLMPDKELLSFFPTKKSLKQECASIYAKMATFGSELVFCHADLNEDNFIYNPELDKIYLIDTDTAGFHYQAYDIAYLFIMYMGLSDPDIVSYPDKKYQLHWLRIYLQCFNDKVEVSDTEVENLYRAVSKFHLVCCLNLVIILLAILQKSSLLTSKGNVAFDRLIVLLLKDYLRKKEDLGI